MNKRELLRDIGITVIIAIVIGLVAWWVGAVYAVAPEKVNVCHQTSSEGNPWVVQEVNANELQSHLDNGDFLYAGPLKENGHPDQKEADEWCEANHPTPSPTPSPSVTPEPSRSPEPSITPEPSVNTGTSEAGGSAEAPRVVCEDIKEIPTIWSVSRNNPMSIHATWSPVDSFVTHYKVEYGLAKGFVLWNTIVEGRDVDLNYLPFNHVLWLRVAGTHNGCVGGFSEWIDP